MRISVSIGICAYNEEKNIGKLLEALINQRTEKIKIKEMIVVSSGSTDKTNEIVKEFSEKDQRIQLIAQPKREGKASAVNEFIKNTSNEICVLESADTIPLKDTIEKLCLPFYDESVGMTGGRPIPVNDKSTFIGFVGHLLWDLHHKISLENPKLGELVAFRNIINGIPKNTAVDEAWIEAMIRKEGYKILYVPKAICYNKAPESVSDFLKQRRRIYAGHLHLKRSLGYGVSTMDAFKIFNLILKNLNSNYREILFTCGAVALELVGRTLGWYDYYIKKKNYVIWEMARTTKELR